VSAGPVRLYRIGLSRRASVPGFTTRVRRSREALFSARTLTIRPSTTAHVELSPKGFLTARAP
jgi:hypothetical protein